MNIKLAVDVLCEQLKVLFESLLLKLVWI